MRVRLVVAVLFAAAPTVHGQNPAIDADAKPDRTDIRLAESVRVTLTVEGPAPLVVILPTPPKPDLPPPLLAANSRAVWRVRLLDPPTVTSLSAGRERWSQVVQFEPWDEGDPLKITFAPIQVRAGNTSGPVTWPALDIRVRTQAKGADPSKLKVTGIEPVPDAPPPPPDPSRWPFAAGVAVVFVLVVAVAAVLRYWARPRALPPREWAAAKFDQLVRDGVSGEDLADRLAAILRGFVARRYGIPASQLTTSESLAEAARAGWPPDTTAALGELLDRCDRAKFAGDEPGEVEGLELVARAREWVSASGAA